MKGEIISTRTVMKKIAKDRKVIPELFVEIDKRIQERINFEKNKEIIEPQKAKIPKVNKVKESINKVLVKIKD